MIMSALYIPFCDQVVKVSTHWVGRPSTEDEVVYALFASANQEVMSDRWYIYTTSRDAVAVTYENLPEAVRLAYMLLT